MSANSIPFIPERIQVKRGVVFGLLIISALVAFEIFNYSTTDFALTDLLGNLRFWGVRWATILAIAFCGIDFAGIARLFTPEGKIGEQPEVWYLFGAWLIAATMNALLTWWGVSIAIVNHETLGNAVIARQTLLKVVPIFVAVMVWLLRVLIIGLFSVAGEKYFGQEQLNVQFASASASRSAPVSVRKREPAMSVNQTGHRPAPKPPARSPRREPSNQPLSTQNREQGHRKQLL
jgi:hypothetical protein